MGDRPSTPSPHVPIRVTMVTMVTIKIDDIWDWLWDSGLASENADSLGHSNWFRIGHMTQVETIRVHPRAVEWSGNMGALATVRLPSSWDVKTNEVCL